MVSRPLLRRYGIAFLYTGFCTGLVSLFPKLFPGNTPFLLFGAATAIAAGYGGLGPGITATALSAIAADLFAVRPIHVWKTDALYHPPIAVFIFIALIVTAIAEILRAAYIRAEVALKEVEHERNRVAFLSEASVAMDASLDLGLTLTSVARLVVPRFADWCAIDLVDESDPNSMHQVAAAHIEREKEELVRKLNTRYPLGANGRHPVRYALQSGEPDVHQNITDQELVSQARDSEQLELLRQLRIRSFMCVPMKARGQAVGTIFYGSSANRRFTASDLKLAQDLAQRAALAVDNASLYRAARDEIAERKRTEETLVRNQEHVAALNQRLRRSMIETHHRVKNNLQIIAAMVDMLLMDENETVSSDELRRLSGHIRALAAVHDILTQKSRDEGETEDVSAKAVLVKLLGLMEGTSQGRRIVSSLAEQELPAKQSTSLALITNELVSNAIKYGKGDIQVRLFRENGHAVLEVCDDGPGFPDGFDPVKAANTGLDLVESLSKWDLSGNTRYESRPEGGARVAIQIPLKS